MRRIVILTHPNDAFNDRRYLLRAIAETWREKGLSVNVLQGPGACPDADLAVLHVDLTVVPADYLAFIRRYPAIVNGGVRDTSKRLISRNLVRRNDGWRGPVLVKTNRNHGGAPEARLARTRPAPLRYLHSLRGRLPWEFRAHLPASSYPIFESADRVPGAVWRNPDLVVERFLPEYRGDRYCLRTWLFFGDRERSAVFFSKHPIVKSGNIIGYEPSSGVPEELRRIRQDLGFDFGKFDYAISGGRAVLYDANRTPALGTLGEGRVSSLARELSEGVHAYLGAPHAKPA